MPFNVAGSAAADDEKVEGSFYWEIKDPAPELILRGWSPDATYDHVITFRVNVMPKTVASMIPVINLLTKLLRRMGVFR